LQGKRGWCGTEIIRNKKKKGRTKRGDVPERPRAVQQVVGTRWWS